MLGIPSSPMKALLMCTLIVALAGCQTTSSEFDRDGFIAGLDKGENVELVKYSSCLMIGYGHMLNKSINENGVAAFDQSLVEDVCRPYAEQYASVIKSKASCGSNSRCPGDTVRQVLQFIQWKASSAAKDYARLYNAS